MDREIVIVESGPSEAVLELGRQYAQEDRSRGIGPAELGPMLYYTVNHVTGKPESRKARPRANNK